MPKAEGFIPGLEELSQHVPRWNGLLTCPLEIGSASGHRSACSVYGRGADGRTCRSQCRHRSE